VTPRSLESTPKPFGLLLSLLLRGCGGPTESAATSCGGSSTFSDRVDSNLFKIVGLTVGSRPGATSGPFRVCFYRDLQRAGEAQQIGWEINDIAIATVDPPQGPETRVIARSPGRTTLRASLGRLSDSGAIVVCQPTGACP
jgi:hypothetical protein